MVSAATTALLLTGCSSDDEKKPPNPPDDTATNATATAGTGEPTNKEGGDGGDFGTAGRLSGNFSGEWPANVILNLSNPSETETYTGTVTVRDCSSGAGRSAFQPPPKSVTVGPNTTPEQPVEVFFSFPQEAKPQRPAHTVCARLTGRSSEMTGEIKDDDFGAPPGPGPNPTPSTPPAPPSPPTAPAPGPQT